MKVNKLKNTFNDLFVWDKKEIENKRDEIDNLMIKLLEKRKILEKKIKKSKNQDNELLKKLNAIKKLIKKAKKNLY